MDRGIELLKIPQQNSPALLFSMTHSKGDFLRAATLKNVAQQPLTGCRLGWVVVFRSGKNEVHLGVRIDIPVGIEPGKTWDFPAQAVNSNYARQEASVVAFFVAEVYLAGCSPWKADLAEVRGQASRMALHR